MNVLHFLQNVTRGRQGSTVGEDFDGFQLSLSGRFRQSPMDAIRPDLAARIIEDALSPTPPQNSIPVSRYMIDHRRC